MDLEKEKLRLELFATQREALRANQQIMQFQMNDLSNKITELDKLIKSEESKLEEERNRNKEIEDNK